MVSGSAPFVRRGLSICSIISPIVVTIPSMAELAWASTSAAAWNNT